MEDVDVVPGGIGPHVELDDPDALLQRLDDGDVAAVAAELVAGEVGVVARVDEVVGERRGHVVVHLRAADGRVEVVGEEEAVEFFEGDERPPHPRDARAPLPVADLVEEPVGGGLRIVVFGAGALGLEVAAEAVGAHGGGTAGVVGEEGAHVVRRRRVRPAVAAPEAEAALVRAHGLGAWRARIGS